MPIARSRWGLSFSYRSARIDSLHKDSPILSAGLIPHAKRCTTKALVFLFRFLKMN